MKRKNKSIVTDVVINLFSIAVTMTVTHLFLYPVLERKFGSELHGEILLLVGIATIFSSAFGNVLNNTRLIRDKTYEENYNLFIVIFLAVSSSIFLLLLLVFFDLNWITIIGLILYNIVFVCRSYFVVYYRISFDYIRLFISNIVLVISSLVLAFFVDNFLYWPFVFFIGEAMSLLFVLLSTPLIKEKWKFNEDAVNILKIFLPLMGISILGSSVAYFDRLVVYPILGGHFVTVFTVAGLFGKIALSAIEAFATVFLGYCTKKRITINKKRYVFAVLVSILLLSLFVVFSFFVEPFFLKILYPDVADEAKGFIVLVNIGISLSCCESIIRPINLSYCSKNKILFVSIVHLVILLPLSILFSFNYGLYGFCIAIIISNIIKFILQVFIGLSHLSRKEVLVNEYL